MMMALLVISYFMLWQPVRNAWGPTLVYPALSDIANARPNMHVSVRGRTVEVVRASPDAPPLSLAVHPPPGVQFLLPALFIVAIAPTRLHWGWFFAGHVLLAVAVMILASGFILGASPFAYLGRGIRAYLVDAYSLGYPIFTYIRRHEALDVMKR